jgi:hypothetical protein
MGKLYKLQMQLKFEALKLVQNFLTAVFLYIVIKNIWFPQDHLVSKQAHYNCSTMDSVVSYLVISRRK